MQACDYRGYTQDVPHKCVPTDLKPALLVLVVVVVVVVVEVVQMVVVVVPPFLGALQA